MFIVTTRSARQAREDVDVGTTCIGPKTEQMAKDQDGYLGLFGPKTEIEAREQDGYVPTTTKIPKGNVDPSLENVKRTRIP